MEKKKMDLVPTGSQFGPNPRLFFFSDSKCPVLVLLLLLCLPGPSRSSCACVALWAAVEQAGVHNAGFILSDNSICLSASPGLSSAMLVLTCGCSFLSSTVKRRWAGLAQGPVLPCLATQAVLLESFSRGSGLSCPVTSHRDAS